MLRRVPACVPLPDGQTGPILYISGIFRTTRPLLTGFSAFGKVVRVSKRYHVDVMSGTTLKPKSEKKTVCTKPHKTRFAGLAGTLPGSVEHQNGPSCVLFLGRLASAKRPKPRKRQGHFPQHFFQKPRLLCRNVLARFRAFRVDETQKNILCRKSGIPDI
jgi:hypothetical protein